MPKAIVKTLVNSITKTGLTLVVDSRVLGVMLIIVLPVMTFYILGSGGVSIRIPIKVAGGGRCLVTVMYSLIVNYCSKFCNPKAKAFLLLMFAGLTGVPLRGTAKGIGVIGLSSGVSTLVAFVLTKGVL